MENGAHEDELGLEEKRRIETIRQLVNAEVIKITRGSRKNAVKALLGSLIAARGEGMSFEDLAKVFEKGGLALSPVTLRTYYFELKTQADLKAAAEVHAQKMRETKKIYDQQLLDMYSDHAKALALDHLRGQEPVMFNAFANVANGSPVQTSATSGSSKPPAPPAAAPRAKPRLVRPKPKVDAPAREPFWAASAGSSVPESRDSSSVATGADPPGSQTGQLRTLDQVAEESLMTEERTELEDDLHLDRNDCVIYKSGKPFVGFLSKKQIHLLRTAGRVVKQASGRTNKDFVKLPTKL